ncbi:glutamate 2,3-aminomutase [Zhaonella formicivorans]|uniref:glutamate 2,3-aminomutase n=1 Tax=Zhaonella formicivorans TaxID=2528593 RepID=UPI0010E760D0|nr:glutamate 2,3-aminomutase [Zhaonella formicivorans]
MLQPEGIKTVAEKKNLHFVKPELSQEEKRQIALRRAAELKSRISDYLQVKDKIVCGLEIERELEDRKKRILSILGGTEEDWGNWKWQMQNRITDVETLGEILGLSKEEKQEISHVGKSYRWAVSPYYASLIDPANPLDPVSLQAVPSGLELESTQGKEDPMGEEFTSPAPCITRRYPDRLIINVTNVCAMYCRHCQRRRNIGETDQHKPRKQIEAALEYIRQNPEIRDVLVTGGDALLLPDDTLDWLLTELDNIPHVEIKRLGTRTLVTMPQRITPELCDVLAKHPPLYINTQFNHPQEVTREAAEACDRLIKAGVVLGNQAVLLKNINNDAHVMKKLNHALLKIRVRPYYIFHAKSVKGTEHFITRVEEGIEIMEQLRGYTSGLAIPTYIINAPFGYGKTPMLPEYLISAGSNKVLIRTWEKKVMEYPNVEREF